MGNSGTKAAALEVTAGKQVIEGGEGSAQVGELRAVVLAAQNGAKVILCRLLGHVGKCHTIALSIESPKLESK